MSVFVDIASSIKDSLSSEFDDSEVKFIAQTPFFKAPNPVNKIYVSVGVAEVEVSEGAFSGYLGIKDSKEVYGKLADVKVKIKIYSPQNLGAESCQDVFSSICDVLLGDFSDVNVQSVLCKEIKYDIDTATFTMECYIKVSGFVGNTINDTSISSFSVIDM